MENERVRDPVRDPVRRDIVVPWVSADGGDADWLPR